jgi:ElaB/YqjD/DUF883 family membrane-anchored ribosome-binding protein
VSSDDLKIEQAKESARAARARLFATLGRIQDRFRPQTLAQDVWREVRDRSTEIADDAVNIARARPLATGAVAAGVLLFAARQPLLRTMSRLFSKPEETLEGDRRLIDKDLSEGAPARESLDETVKEMRYDRSR